MRKSKSPNVSYLQQRLREKMSEIGISAHALEKQAGLKRSAVQNILHGRSKKPSAQILLAVTKILGCDINELLSHHLEGYTDTRSDTSTPQTLNDAPMDIGLYAEAAQVANEIMQSLAIKPAAPQIMHYIEEIYSYSLRSQKSTIDRNFAQWLVNKSLKPLKSDET
jgi:transcriptional regulator with XRE-family HTH domain